MGSGVENSRSEPGVVFEERTHEIITAPAPPPVPHQNVEIVTDTKIVETRSTSPHHHHHHSSHHNPIIIEAGRPRGEEYSDPVPVGALALVRPHSRHSFREDRAVRAEIAILEAERAKRHSEREYRRVRRSGHGSEGELVLYERDTYDGPSEEITLVRREREPEGGVRIEKDRKGRMSISVPKYVR